MEELTGERGTDFARPGAPGPGLAPAAAALAAPGRPAAGTALGATTRHGLAVAGTAVVLGVAGDGLLRAAPWGLNLALWVALAAAAVWLLRGWARPAADVRWVAVAAALAALPAWRDSPALKAWALLALAGVVGLGMHHALGGGVVRAGVAGYAAGLGRAVGEVSFGAGLLLGRDVRWAEIPRGGAARHLTAVARGLAIAAPLLVVFGALLAGADAVFEGLLREMFHFDLPLVFSHVFLAAVLAWASAGVLRVLFVEPGRARAIDLPRPMSLSLGVVEVAIVLGLLNALFLAFVAVQLRWLFGGAEVVTADGSTVSYADWARRGFFELVTVTGLVLPLLLALHWLLRRETPGPARAFRWLAGAQVVLVGVMMASAMRRMWLYTQAYGLTEQRVYATAFMAWLAVVFGWFAWTVLRGARERFVFGGVVAGLGTLAVLHAVSPDALIVRVNASRDAAAVRFDAVYAASLSGDAVPALVGALGRADGEGQCVAARRLLERWGADGGDWRSWSWGRSRAYAAVSANRAALERVASSDGCPDDPVIRPVVVVGKSLSPALEQKLGEASAPTSPDGSSPVGNEPAGAMPAGTAPAEAGPTERIPVGAVSAPGEGDRS